MTASNTLELTPAYNKDYETFQKAELGWKNCYSFTAKGRDRKINILHTNSLKTEGFTHVEIIYNEWQSNIVINL